MDLHKFFEEKELSYKLFEIEHNGETHFIDTETVIQLIISTKGEERRKISGTLSILDFKNSSIMDYLQFLAKCFIAQNSAVSC